MIDDNFKVFNTWLGGKLVVENKKITSLLDKQLSFKRYRYPKKAYRTIKIPNKKGIGLDLDENWIDFHCEEILRF